MTNLELNQIHTKTPKSFGQKIVSGIIWLCFLVVLIAGIMFIFHYLANRPKPQVELPPPIKVSTSILQMGEIIPKYSFIGEIRAKQTASVSAELNNVRILSLAKDIGDVVKIGDVLATFDNQALIHQRDQAQSTYEQARDEYQRKNRLGINGGISEEELVIKRTAMQAAKSRLDEAELNLSKSTLKSPVDGIITNRHQDIGSLVSTASALFTIAVNSETEFVAQIPENQLPLFKIGQAVNVSLSGIETSLAGTIRLIQPTIDNNQRTANIFIAFEDPTFKPIGLFGIADITLTPQTGLSVPTTALLLDDIGHYIWAVNKDNVVFKLYVKEIGRQDSQAVIEIDKTHSNVADIQNINAILRAGTLVNEGDTITPENISNQTTMK